MTPKERAKQATEDLFTNAFGEKACRLALISAEGGELGGWNFDETVKRIERQIEEALKEQCEHSPSHG